MSTNYPYHSRFANPHRVSLWPLLLLLVLAGVLIWRFWPRHRTTELSADAVPRVVSESGPLKPDEQTTIAVYEMNAPSVVHITNLAERPRGFSMRNDPLPRGSGSGFVWSDRGIIVTNAHVVEGADAMKVFLPDKEHTSYDAISWVSYPAKDLAVLYVDAPKSKLRPIPKVGVSKKLRVGQNAYAIGNPFGLDQTLTTGVISALDREIKSDTGRPIQGVIQSSAAINPGNSGGPLLDSDGSLIGMNTAIISPSGASAGIGFAIPVDEINRLVPKLIERLDESVKQNKGPEEIKVPWLGVGFAPDPYARGRGVSDGALILEVYPRSPAARAGLRGLSVESQRLGDVIVAIDGEPVQAYRDVVALLDDHHPGDTITLGILRDGKRMDVKVTLGTSAR
jgi:S1-C subfamily serine protease